MENEEIIRCNCIEECGSEGVESNEVAGHTEDCSCGYCHSMVGKISPHYKIENFKREE